MARGGVRTMWKKKSDKDKTKKEIYYSVVLRRCDGRCMYERVVSKAFHHSADCFCLLFLYPLNPLSLVSAVSAGGRAMIKEPPDALPPAMQCNALHCSRSEGSEQHA